MQAITSTHLARHLREVLDRVEFRHDSVTVVRNKKPIARIVPGVRHITALEAMSDLYGIVDSRAAEHWAEEGRTGGSVAGEMKDPWAS